MLILTHIPRTGGTSLRKMISRELKSSAIRYIDSIPDFAFLSDAELNQYDFVATYCGFGLFNRLLSLDHQKMTFLRNPIDRIISYYYHLKSLDKDSSYAIYCAKNMPLDAFIQSNHPAIYSSVHNAQTWHIFYDKSSYFRDKYKHLKEEEILRIAIENLKTFDFLGVTERYSDNLVKLFEYFNWNNKDILHTNQAVERIHLEEVSSKTMALIKSRVYLDIELYNKALELT
jgi:hypothetical protein